MANESIVKLKSSESNYSLLDKHLLSFGTVLVPEMCVHTIDPSIEGPASSFADEYADQLSREFQQTPDRISDGIPQFDVLILGLDPEGRAAGLVAPPTLSVPPPHRHSVVSCVKLLITNRVSLRFPSVFAFLFSCHSQAGTTNAAIRWCSRYHRLCCPLQPLIPHRCSNFRCDAV